MTKLKVTQVRSVIRESKAQKDVMKALGLRRIRQSVVRSDTPQIRGMVNKVRHLISVEEVEE